MGALVFISCEKNTQETTTKDFYVNEKGILEFRTFKGLNSYIDLLKKSSHKEIQEKLKEENFELKTELQLNNSKINLEEFGQYLFNKDGCIQLGDLIVFGKFNSSNISELTEFYVVDEHNLSAYANLVNHSYTSPGIKGLKSAELFVKLKEIGFITTQAATRSVEENLGNPFWGWGEWHNTTCEPVGTNPVTGSTEYYRCREKDYYVFGIDVGTKKDCWYAYGCL